jgi:hypothetical protein
MGDALNGGDKGVEIGFVTSVPLGFDEDGER